MNKRKTISHTGNRTRIGRVRACYPNQLDYMGPVLPSHLPSFSPSSNLLHFHSLLQSPLLFVMPIDINLLRISRGGNPDLVRESQKKRFASVELVDEVIALDDVIVLISIYCSNGER